MIKIQAIGRISAIAAAAALAVTAIVPAGATVADPAGVVSAPAGAKKSTRYCVADTLVGSRIARKTCKTRDEWIKAEGFDPIRRHRG